MKLFHIRIFEVAEVVKILNFNSRMLLDLDETWLSELQNQLQVYLTVAVYDNIFFFTKFGNIIQLVLLGDPANRKTIKATYWWMCSLAVELNMKVILHYHHVSLFHVDVLCRYVFISHYTPHLVFDLSSVHTKIVSHRQ